MPIKVKDTVAVNVIYVENVLSKRPSTPVLRQTLTSLERLSNITSTVLDRGWVAKPDRSGAIIYFITLVPTISTHIAYRPPQDGPGRGIAIFFETAAELDASFLKI